MSNVIGINELFKMLDDYRIIKTNEIELEIINEKQKELGIEFPEAMILFYKYFGNDEKSILKVVICFRYMVKMFYGAT